MNRHCHGCFYPDASPCEGIEGNRNLTSDSIILEMDGDAWCAKRRNFSNIQESCCGFGETPTDAVDDLLEAESR